MRRLCSKFALPGLALALSLAVLAPAGCGFLGIGGAAKPTVTTPPGPQEGQPESVLPGGVLRSIAAKAPPQSAVQYLALLADRFGWEPDVAQNTLLADAVAAQAWPDRVEPFMLGLFFSKGFSVLPSVGEGHEFSRDAIVKGPLGQARYLVTTREAVRIILLMPATNVELVYPQDGAQPQVFTLDAKSSVAVRQSRLAQYLR